MKILFQYPLGPFKHLQTKWIFNEFFIDSFDGMTGGECNLKQRCKHFMYFAHLALLSWLQNRQQLFITSSPSSVSEPVLSKENKFKLPTTLIFGGALKKMLFFFSLRRSHSVPTAITAVRAGGTTTVIRYVGFSNDVNIRTNFLSNTIATKPTTAIPKRHHIKTTVFR